MGSQPNHSGDHEGHLDEGKPTRRYPEHRMPLASSIEERYETFCDLREAMLLDYEYNTARAYWADLDDLYLWSEQRNKDILALTAKDIRQYIALLRRRKYSENTIRRRTVSFRHFYTRAMREGERTQGPIVREATRRAIRPSHQANAAADSEK